jgi:hypothetical protein
MASLNKTPTGFTVQFSSLDGKRRSIRLGYLTRTQAEGIKGWIERINAAQLAGLPLDEDSARWLSRLGDTLHDRIAATRLTSKRSSGLLGAHLRHYLSEHSLGLAASTRSLWEYTIGNLLACFDENQPLRELTTAHGERFRLWCKSQGMSENTIRRRCGLARQFLAPAVVQRRLEANPFAEVATRVQGGKAEFFITPDMAKQVLEACPNLQWRLLFGLCRFGGFRHPSETSRLTWGDIYWDQHRIRVTSPKTERHEGHEGRWIPLFSSLRPLLDEAWDAATTGDSAILTGSFDAGAMKRIIRKAGLSPWPKTFQNLRSSRQSELLCKNPAHVVAAWLGHSERTAGEFYSQVTEQDFAQGLEA